MSVINNAVRERLASHTEQAGLTFPDLEVVTVKNEAWSERARITIRHKAAISIETDGTGQAYAGVTIAVREPRDSKHKGPDENFAACDRTFKDVKNAVELLSHPGMEEVGRRLGVLGLGFELADGTKVNTLVFGSPDNLWSNSPKLWQPGRDGRSAKGITFKEDFTSSAVWEDKIGDLANGIVPAFNDPEEPKSIFRVLSWAALGAETGMRICAMAYGMQESQDWNERERATTSAAFVKRLESVSLEGILDIHKLGEGSRHARIISLDTLVYDRDQNRYAHIGAATVAEGVKQQLEVGPPPLPNGLLASPA